MGAVHSYQLPSPVHPHLLDAVFMSFHLTLVKKTPSASNKDKKKAVLAGRGGARL